MFQVSLPKRVKVGGASLPLPVETDPPRGTPRVL